MNETVRLGIGIALLGVFAIAALSHFVILLMRIVSRRRTPSAVPLVGGLAGMVGVLILPYPDMHWLWWVPLIADIGTGPMVIGTGIMLAIHKRNTNGAGN